MTPGMATVREAATLLDWSETTIRKGFAAGWIPGIQAGPRGSIRISRAWIGRVLDGEESVGQRFTQPKEVRRPVDRPRQRRQGRAPLRHRDGRASRQEATAGAGTEYDFSTGQGEGR